MDAYTADAIVAAVPPPLSLPSLSLLPDTVAAVHPTGVDVIDGGGISDGVLLPSTVSHQLNVTYAVLEGLVAVGATVGNGLVIVAFRRERRLRRRTNYYIVSLAVADLLVGLVGIPCAVLSSIGLPKDLYQCVFSVSLIVVLCTVSILSLVAVSADRYWAILYPMAYSTNSNTKIAISIICICWIMGLLIGFMPLMGWRAVKEEPLESCQFSLVMDYNYLVFLYIATIILPALFMAISYAHIYTVIIKQIKQMTLLNGGRYNGDSPTKLRVLGAARKSEVKATQNLSIIVAFFAVCWMPLYTINCVQAFCNQCTVSATLLDGCIILSHLNSAGNPLLYAYHLKDFRRAFKSLLTCSSSRPQHQPPRNTTASAAGRSATAINGTDYSISSSSVVSCSGGVGGLATTDCWRWSTESVLIAGRRPLSRWQSHDLSYCRTGSINACTANALAVTIDPSTPVLLSVRRLVE